MVMKRFSILFGFILMIAFSAGCSQKPTVISVSKEPFIINDSPTVLTLEQPLYRRNRSLSIRMKLHDSWTPRSPFKDIRLEDGTAVTIDVVLISEKEGSYRQIAVGEADGLDIRFEDSVPKEEGIKKIILTSSYPISARSIKWVDWNPN